MAQFGRPEADTTIGNYQNQAGGTTNIWNTIDEDSGNLNDADYIRSPQTPNNQVYVCKLSNCVDPSVSTGHTVRWRAGKDVGAGSEVIDMTTQLRVGYQNESVMGTQIFSDQNNNIASAFSNYSHALNATEADAITDYNNMFIRFIFNKP